MPILVISIGILCLFILIMLFRLNAFLSFILVSLGVGIAQGMELSSIVGSLEKGMGDTLGFLIMILGLGAMLGKLVAESGAAQRITSSLIRLFGLKNTQWAVMLTGFIVGITLFYSVGFVILVPLVFSVAASTRLPLISVALPMLAALSVTHGYLPPHPAPTAIAGMFDADMGKTLMYGIVVAVPAIVISGYFILPVIKKVDAQPLKEFTVSQTFPEDQLPGIGISLLIALLPVILIGLATILNEFLFPEGAYFQIISFLGNPVIALLLAVLAGIWLLGLRRGKTIDTLMGEMASSVTGITMVLLIIAGAGGLKQILIDSGISAYIGELLKGTTGSPLILGWFIATLLRVSIGSATVAGLTTAGIIFPIVQNTGVSPELMVLAIGAGSIMLSHVNDSGFWLFKEYFNLSVKDTLATWTVMETSIGVVGLIGVLILNQLV
ncbi:MAG: gluconate:H+ symporter [Saprospiraceae bacterium]